MSGASDPDDFEHGDTEPIDGGYVWVKHDGEKHRTYFERAGTGPVPLVCLHAAGADSRQFRHLLNDERLQKLVTVYAFDMPWHGRSYPPLTREWWREAYQLTTDGYAGFIAAFVDALDIVDPIALGCSMGGSIVLELAHSHSDRFRAVIGLEATAFAPSRDFDYFGHPKIDQEVMRPEWAYSFQAPQSPERFKREAWWIYSQAGHGTFSGDLYFYGSDWDAREFLVDIDTDACGVYLMTGEYDFSATPADTRSAAEKIDGAYFQELPEMGHFPMAEDPDAFTEHLFPVLEDILDSQDT
jgi:pimeloyl-ACP methyl ester carboxylesterase